MTRGELAKRVSDGIEELYTRGTIVGDDGRAYEFESLGMPREIGRFIGDLVRSERPGATVETQMAWGPSLLFILEALLEGSQEFQPHVVIDPFEATRPRNTFSSALRALGIADLVEFHDERSEVVLSAMIQQGRQFGLAYVNADHRFDALFVEFRLMHSLLRPGGVVIFEDSDWDSVHLVCRFAETNLGYDRVAEAGSETRAAHKPDPMDAPARARITAYRKPIQEPERVQRHLVPFFEGVPRLAKTRAGELRHEGLAALAMGDRGRARSLFKLSLAYRRHAKTYMRLLRAFLPTNAARLLSAPTRRTISKSAGAPRKAEGNEIAATQVSKEKWRVAQKAELQFWESCRPADNWNGWWSRQFDDYAIIPNHLGRAIELGCGPVTNVRLIRVGRSVEQIVCSDPLADEYLKLPNSWLRRAREKGEISVENFPAEECPYPDGHFDLVVLINVLDHVRDADACLQSAMRITSPSGFLIVGQDLSDEGHAPGPGQNSAHDIAHPIKLDDKWLDQRLLKSFEPKMKRLLSREDGRAPSLHYGTYLFIGQKNVQALPILQS